MWVSGINKYGQSSSLPDIVKGDLTRLYLSSCLILVLFRVYFVFYLLLVLIWFISTSESD